MNQILYTGKVKTPASLISIIRFFAICLILLGFIFIGKGSYAIYQGYELNKLGVKNADSAEISFDRDENIAIIAVKHVKGISKVKYHWNNEEEKIEQGNSMQTFEVNNIKISPGINTLYVTAIDTNGNATNSSYDYSYEGTYINISVVDTSRLDSASVKISATDLQGLSYITYKLNSDEEVPVYPTGEDKTKIEHLIEVPLGYNTISVTGINSENKLSTASEKFKINRPPTVELYLEGYDLVVNISDEDGIDRFTLQIDNGEVITINGNNEAEISYRHNIKGHHNSIVTVTAYDTQDAPRTYRGLTD